MDIIPKVPPLIGPMNKPAKRLSGWVICGIAFPPVMMLLFGLWLAFRPGATAQVNVNTSSGVAATDDDLNRLTNPDVGYDAEKEPPPGAVEQFGWSKEDTAEFRLWMAAGLPRYWKGKNRFPALNDEQWSELRRKFRINLAERNRTNPPPARGY